MTVGVSTVADMLEHVVVPGDKAGGVASQADCEVQNYGRGGLCLCLFPNVYNKHSKRGEFVLLYTFRMIWVFWALLVSTLGFCF